MARVLRHRARRSVRLTTRRGSGDREGAADSIPSAWTRCFVPFHFGGRGSANLLTNPALDPVSQMPEFKVCAVRIRKRTHVRKTEFLQGCIQFEGGGLDKPSAFDPALTYKVPFDKRSQLIYFRAGNPRRRLIYVLLLRDGKPMRYFPIGAKGATHVRWPWSRIWQPETVLEVLIAAHGEGSQCDSVVLDIGLDGDLGDSVDRRRNEISS